ncbi:hypothetical protein [Methylotenera sp.]|uniref:hypothetical protein n=1 Tax=Methylotenera sp. TaxID=2051956 RepID=UPI00272F9EEA|nr:hypothetical protein [Methylotenera sp.]MDP2230526.1 hypothetical protein [Methylotenera sp.]MDP3140317.1 hypothetical protein [Methylotenera sp.]
MSYPIRLSLFSFIFCLITTLSAQAAVSDISRIYKELPTKEGFDVCFGGGCAEIRRVSLNQEEWLKVEAIFADKTKDAQLNAEFERKQIANAIGLLETIVGIKIGTATDRAGTFNNSKFPGQLDCNDESINTTTYMQLMHHYGLIKLHGLEDMRTRNFFFNGWPHSTAVIREISTGRRYAVDSWFYDNGVPATIVPFEVWKSGYIPTDSPVQRH